MDVNRIEQTRRELEKQGKKIINLSSGNPGEFGVRFPQEILSRAFSKFQTEPVYSPDPKGNVEARRAVVQFYEQRGLKISAENILLTSGTSESYLHLFKLLAKPGDEILFPNPSYPLFDHIAKLADIELNHYELDANTEGWQIDLKNLESKISPKTKAIVLVSPNNPTGGVLTGPVLSKVLAIAQKHNLTVISDEVFSEFIFDGEIFPRACALADSAAAQNVNIFTLNGISKTYALPGLKLSWIVATGPRAAEYLEELELSVDTLLACNQMSQAMLPDIIVQGDEFLQNYRARVEQSRNTAMKILGSSQNITFNKPCGAFYIFAQIRNFPGTDEDFVIEIMKRTGIFVHPGYFYDYEKTGSKGVVPGSPFEEWSGLHVLISFLMEAGELSSTLERFVQATNLLCHRA